MANIAEKPQKSSTGHHFDHNIQQEFETLQRLDEAEKRGETDSSHYAKIYMTVGRLILMLAAQGRKVANQAAREARDEVTVYTEKVANTYGGRIVTLVSVAGVVVTGLGAGFAGQALLLKGAAGANELMSFAQNVSYTGQALPQLSQIFEGMNGRERTIYQCKVDLSKDANSQAQQLGQQITGMIQKYFDAMDKVDQAHNSAKLSVQR